MSRWRRPVRERQAQHLLLKKVGDLRGVGRLARAILKLTGQSCEDFRGSRVARLRLRRCGLLHCDGLCV